MKITKDGFIWKVITYKQAKVIFNTFLVFELNDNDTESLIPTLKDLKKAKKYNAVFGLEVGFLLKKNKDD